MSGLHLLGVNLLLTIDLYCYTVLVDVCYCWSCYFIDSFIDMVIHIIVVVIIIIIILVILFTVIQLPIIILLAEGHIFCFSV